MRFRPFMTLFSAAVALAALEPRALFAGMSPEEQARRAAPVAHVGSAIISAGELEDRLAAVPRFQLHAFGDTADAIRRKFFDQVILPEVLYALAGQKEHLGDQMPTSNKILRTLAGANTRAQMEALRPPGLIGIDEIKQYYEAHRDKYDTPERLNVYRILCSTKKAADEVLELARTEKTLDVFSHLAHDMSIDKATNTRGGNLGFLMPDGTSSEAGIKVDPEVFRAAASVKDGEFVPLPVVEKTGADTVGYAVVWRRGTVPANHRTVEEAAGQIREQIWKEEADKAARKHLEELRAAHVTELNESLLNAIDITGTEADIVTRRRPGEVPPLTQVGRNVPHSPR